MKIRVLGAGFYGCHIASFLLELGHDVDVHEIRNGLFMGASGHNPSRLHLGYHYPRSRLTRAACQEHHAEFMARYGHLTQGVRTNIYAIAAHDSLVDFGTYKQVLRGEVEFVEIDKPIEFGLHHVEGALLTGERHIVIDRARAYFSERIGGSVHLEMPPGEVNDPRWDWTIDCTFCANDATNIERFEPCLTVLLEGPTDWAVTIMDGPFPSLFAWNEERGLSSLTSAKWTPFARCATWTEARALLDNIDAATVLDRGCEMFKQMGRYWPRIFDEYRIVDHLLSIRAMPKSAADARLVDVVQVGERALRVRAGKIDAVFMAARMVKEMIESKQRRAA